MAPRGDRAVDVLRHAGCGGTRRRVPSADARFAAERARLATLVADGIVEWHGSRLWVTPEGAPLIRVAAAAFDAYLNAGPGRHSRAV